MGSKDFLKTLNYASCNEDWRSEWNALQISPEDTVLCITGSGDRPLDLLPEGPKKIIAMDYNPVQNHLLQLKISALQNLPYAEYSAFLGLNNGVDRVGYYQKIRSTMPSESQIFWDERQKVLKSGVIYQGRWEKHFKKLALISKILRRRVIRDLFQFDDLDDQLAFVQRKWDRRWWRYIFRILCSAGFSKTFFGDPGFYENVSKEMSLGEYVFEGMKYYLETQLARESFMMSLIFQGRLSEYDLPPYLDPEYTELIKERVDRIEVKTGNILDYMEGSEHQKFDKFSLSDVPSFLDQEGFERLLDAIISSARPDARVCIRLFLSDQKVPERYEKTFVRDPELELQLKQMDRSFGYRFIAGQIRSNE